MNSTFEEGNVAGRHLVSVSRRPNTSVPVDEFSSTIPKESEAMFLLLGQVGQAGQDYTESIPNGSVIILDASECHALKLVGKVQHMWYQVDWDSSSFRVWDCLHSIEFLTSPPVEFNQARLAVKSFSDLTDDWDGANGRPPSQRAIDESSILLSQLEQLEVIEPKTMLSNDGEIGLYWRTDRCYLEIGVMGSGNWGAYGIAHGREPELMIDDHPIDKKIPDLFVEFLQEAKLL